jgi:hypothetical protein
VGKRTAESAAMTNLRIADMAGCVCKQWCVCGQHRADFEIAVARECTNGDVIAGIVDVSKVIKTANIDKDRRSREAQLHEWEEGMSASKKLGFVAVFGECGESGIDGVGTDVVERCGDHFDAPCDSAAHARTDFTML